jgi:hypothetical protein
VNQRLKSIEVRKGLTDEWENHGVQKGREFAILTDDITKAWSGFTTKNYRKHKGLKKENPGDNMTNLELVLNMLAEATTTEISIEKEPKTFEDNRAIAKQGGTIAGNTRKAIEEKTGKKVISKLNAKQLQRKLPNKISDETNKFGKKSSEIIKLPRKQMIKIVYAVACQVFSPCIA